MNSRPNSITNFRPTFTPNNYPAFDPDDHPAFDPDDHPAFDLDDQPVPDDLPVPGRAVQTARTTSTVTPTNAQTDRQYIMTAAPIRYSSLTHHYCSLYCVFTVSQQDQQCSILACCMVDYCSKILQVHLQ